ncbi:MAG TPA: hypothetical protein VGY48_33230, partial [Vicinamibacterales bacterium]|nr:hypothetical protein [Vicinamibacterales bacterium]
MNASVAGLTADRLETILEDGEFVLCRRADPGDATGPGRSALVVLVRSEHPRPQAVRMLEHEYALREELDAAWAARSL